MSKLSKNQTNKLLFSFLENIYQFQQLEFKIFNLTWQQIYFLQLLKKKKIFTVTDISQFLNIELYQASRLTAVMLKAGFIEKNQNKQDKRIFSISITKKGLEIIENIENFNFEVISKNSKKIDDKEIETLISALKKLKDILF